MNHFFLSRRLTAARLSRDCRKGRLIPDCRQDRRRFADSECPKWIKIFGNFICCVCVHYYQERNHHCNTRFFKSLSFAVLRICRQINSQENLLAWHCIYYYRLVDCRGRQIDPIRTAHKVCRQKLRGKLMSTREWTSSRTDYHLALRHCSQNPIASLESIIERRTLPIELKKAKKNDQEYCNTQRALQH